MLGFVKAHCYGNDFICVNARGVRAADAARVARVICDRHAGIGADGLLLVDGDSLPMRMTLKNADGSAAEVSGNGVRCVGAIAAAADTGLITGRDAPPPRPNSKFTIETDGGSRELTLLDASPPDYTFRANMGRPEGVRTVDLAVDGETVQAVVLSMGNPHCVVLTGRLDDARFHRLGPRLVGHDAFPAGTNVELVRIEQPDRVQIRIWERGVGPTTASGTGACAAAVAAAAHGGAARELDVVSPGGTQHVEWRTDGVFLTGKATIIACGEWRGD